MYKNIYYKMKIMNQRGPAIFTNSIIDWKEVV